MDYIILLLAGIGVLVILIVHQDIVQFGEGYNKIISRLCPQLGSVNRSMKNAVTLGCAAFFGGVIAHAYTSDDSWVWNGLVFAIVPPLIQLFRGKWKKSSS